MFRPINAKIYEPDNPEHSLVDALQSEVYYLESPEIIYWCVDKVSNNATLDDLDQIYGEKSSGNTKLIFFNPVQIYGKVESNPILQELTRVGLTTIEEIDLYVNIADTISRLRREPLDGDVFRLSHMIRGVDGNLKKKITFYQVANVVTVDLYNYQYINYQINAEQTNLADVPDSVVNYKHSTD